MIEWRLLLALHINRLNEWMKGMNKRIRVLIIVHLSFVNAMWVASWKLQSVVGIYCSIMGMHVVHMLLASPFFLSSLLSPPAYSPRILLRHPNFLLRAAKTSSSFFTCSLTHSLFPLRTYTDDPLLPTRYVPRLEAVISLWEWLIALCHEESKDLNHHVSVLRCPRFLDTSTISVRRKFSLDTTNAYGHACVCVPQ